jgi:hypothetical protein
MPFRWLVLEILREKGSKCVKIGREANAASHGLAQIGGIHARTQMWLRQTPTEISEATAEDCNSSFI